MIITIVKHLYPKDKNTFEARTAFIGVTYHWVLANSVGTDIVIPKVGKDMLFPYFDDLNDIRIFTPSYGPNGANGKVMLTQGNEIIVDPYNTMLNSTIDDWFSDYHNSYLDVIVYHIDDVITLHYNRHGIWNECNIEPIAGSINTVGIDGVFFEKVSIFSSSYDGRGISIPVVLGEKGQRIMGIKGDNDAK